MERPPPHVVIDLKTIYDQILILNTRVELLMSGQLEQGKDVADHESRIRTLEKSRWPLPSIGVLLSLGALALSIARG